MSEDLKIQQLKLAAGIGVDGDIPVVSLDGHNPQMGGMGMLMNYADLVESYVANRLPEARKELEKTPEAFNTDFAKYASEQFYTGPEIIKALPAEILSEILKEESEPEDENSEELTESAISDEDAEQLKDGLDNPDVEGVEVMDKDITVEDAEEKYRSNRKDDESLEKTIPYPEKVKASIQKRLSELDASIAEYYDKGYADKHNVILLAKDALNKIDELLAKENSEGVTQAKIFFTTLMSPITDLIPPVVVKHLTEERI